MHEHISSRSQRKERRKMMAGVSFEFSVARSDHEQDGANELPGRK